VIIDCHTHIFPAEMRTDRQSLCMRDEGFSAIYGNVKASMAGAEELLASMDEAEVKASVICGFAWSEPCSALATTPIFWNRGTFSRSTDPVHLPSRDPGGPVY